jgi:glycosyltransferase involved in cell wall biosynthesis
MDNGGDGNSNDGNDNNDVNNSNDGSDGSDSSDGSDRNGGDGDSNGLRVSLLTPTYNRRNFLRVLIKIVDRFDYPKSLIDWIIIDDGTEDNTDLFVDVNYARYYHLAKKITLARKRNMLNILARGDILVCIDDDDYYPPNRIKHAIDRLRETEAEIAGAKDIMTFFIRTREIMLFKQKSIGAATMAYTKNYALTHSFGQNSTKKKVTKQIQFIVDNSGEEKKFVDFNTTKIADLETKETILVISHKKNTIDKEYYKYMCATGRARKLKCLRSTLKISNIIKDPELVRFYQRCN